jgi:hypothetical protein
MCQRCQQEVAGMDIKATDLQYLPFKWVKWQCIVPDCKGGCKVKDYGIPGYYFDPVKPRITKEGWRGGWFSNDHTYACSRHFNLIKARKMEFPDTSPEVAATKFVEVKKKS